MWRVGGGHPKPRVAVFFFAWAGSTVNALFHKTGWTVSEMNLDMLEESPLGIQTFFPAMLGGRGWTCIATGIFLMLWNLLVRYSESSGTFTVV